MRLIDFLEYEPFLRLREKMCAERLGSFELFDCENHLTSKEKTLLGSDGLIVPIKKVRVLKDSTLAYKNSRVLMVGAGKKNEVNFGSKYHFSDCQDFVDFCAVGYKSEALLFTSLSVFGSKNCDVKNQYFGGDAKVESFVCQGCLQKGLFFCGEELRRGRRRFREQKEAQFSLELYFKRFHQYPLSAEDFSDEFLF